jgi:hypothetical protein
VVLLARNETLRPKRFAGLAIRRVIAYPLAVAALHICEEESQV